MKLTYAKHYHNETDRWHSDSWVYHVESSSIKIIHHYLWVSDSGSQVSELTIHFVNGSVYRYEEVPVTVVLSLISAESVGKAFHQLVKKGGYAYRKVKEADPKPTASLSEVSLPE